MNIKKLTKSAIMPTKGSEYAAGWDLYADVQEDVVIEPAATVLIGTGWAVEIPIGYFGAIFARSGLAVKEGLRPANCVGVIDSDYRGEVKVALHNDSTINRTVTPRSRVAQLVLIPYNFIDELHEVQELNNTNRGTGGFGSTGK